VSREYWRSQLELLFVPENPSNGPESSDRAILCQGAPSLTDEAPLSVLQLLISSESSTLALSLMLGPIQIPTVTVTVCSYYSAKDLESPQKLSPSIPSPKKY
jgi:hypothetical protein